MPQFLFVVEVPPTPPGSTEPTYPREYKQFASESSAILKNAKTYTKLQTNAWLLPVENFLPDLSRMSAAAEQNHLSYSVLLIPDGVIALTAPAKPKT